MKICAWGLAKIAWRLYYPAEKDKSNGSILSRDHRQNEHEPSRKISYFGDSSIGLPCECTSTLLSPFKRWRRPEPKFDPKLFAGYRSRPGGSAEGGMWGVDEGVPEFAETLLGAGCGRPMPTFISRCSLAQRGQNALPVSSSRRLASS